VSKFEDWLEKNPLPELDKDDDTMKGSMQLLKAMAKFNHQERVAKTPDRIEYAIKRFEEENIIYNLKNKSIGHFHLWDSQGNLFQFWASTGKIWFDKKTKDARGFTSFYRDYRGIENCIRIVKYFSRREI
jgi:hypothetical protein